MPIVPMILFSMVSCSTAPKYVNSFDVKNSNLKHESISNTVSKVEFINESLIKQYKENPKLEKENAKIIKEHLDALSPWKAEPYMTKINETFSGEAFYWSDREKCYNAFIGRKKDAGYEKMQKYAKEYSKQKIEEMKKNAKSSSELETIEANAASIERMILLGVESHYSQNASRIQLCRYPQGDKFQVRMIFDGKLVKPNTIKATVIEDKKNKLVKINFEGVSNRIESYQYTNYDEQASNRATSMKSNYQYGGIDSPYGKNKVSVYTTTTQKYHVGYFKIKGSVKGRLVDEVKEVNSSERVFRTEKWGEWSFSDLQTWFQ